MPLRAARSRGRRGRRRARGRGPRPSGGRGRCRRAGRCSRGRPYRRGQAVVDGVRLRGQDRRPVPTGDRKGSSGVSDAVRPRGPFSLRVSARHAGDSTRTRADGPLVAALDDRRARPRLAAAGRDRPAARARRARARSSSASCSRSTTTTPSSSTRSATTRCSAERCRGCAACARCASATVTHSLLRAVCGQLIQARLAREIERNVIRAATPAVEGTRLRLPPTAAALARFAPAELRRLGLGARRGATLVRLCRSLDLERLRSLPDRRRRRAARARARPRPVVGRRRLPRGARPLRARARRRPRARQALLGARGRRVEAWETAELLEPYGEWAGLASVYLLAGVPARGLVPLAADAPLPRLRAWRGRARVAILGAGTIGEALLRGLLSGGWREPAEIVVTVRDEERARELAERHGVEATTLERRGRRGRRARRDRGQAAGLRRRCSARSAAC